jgi:hypothetical protein
MKNIYISLIIILAAAYSFISCTREPVRPPEPIINNITIANLRSIYDQGITTIDTNVYIQGIITLTPEYNNLPSFIAYIQDATAGICLTVTGTNTFTLNSEVKIVCRGLSFTDYNGLLQFGDISIGDQSELISLTPAPLDPVPVTLDEILAGEHQGEYVMINDVQFKDPGTFSGTRTLTDCNSSVDVYTRSDAIFASESLPEGNGIFRGVASVYTAIQLLLRDPAELSMAADRCGNPTMIYITQDFNSIVQYADVSTLNGWLTYPEQGTKTWYGNTVSGLGTWVQATAYNSGQASVNTWMIAPQVDLTSASEPYVQFESADGYDNGATLELYASTDYTGSATPWTSTWTLLSFTHPPGSPSGYSDFISSGQVDLSAFNGSTMYVAWVYKGGAPSQTTTWEVDNVIIAEK